MRKKKTNNSNVFIHIRKLNMVINTAIRFIILTASLYSLNCMALPIPTWESLGPVTLKPCILAPVLNASVASASGNLKGSKGIAVGVLPNQYSDIWGVPQRMKSPCSNDTIYGIPSHDGHAAIVVTPGPYYNKINFTNSNGPATAIPDLNMLAGTVSTGKHYYGGGVGKQTSDILIVQSKMQVSPSGDWNSGFAADANDPIGMLWPAFYTAMLSNGWDYDSHSPGVPFYINAQLSILWDGTNAATAVNYELAPAMFKACLGGVASPKLSCPNPGDNSVTVTSPEVKVTGPGQNSVCNFNPIKVIAAMATISSAHGYNPVVIAHRGLWQQKPTAPENSLSSLDNADKSCIEAVELDVKSTSNKVPVVMHDFTLGGTTSISDGSGTPDFNPYKNNATKRNNPKVDEISSATVSALKLRETRASESTKEAGSYSDETVPSVEDVYNHYYQKRMSSVIVWDIKDKKTALTIAKILSQDSHDYSQGSGLNLKARDITVFKLNAPIFSKGSSYVNYMKSNGVANPPVVIPIYTTNMEEKLKRTGGTLGSLKSWQSTAGKFFLSPEIDLKQDNGIMSDTMNYAIGNNLSVGVFNAIPDWSGGGTTVPDVNKEGGFINADKAFFNNKSLCCYQLSDHFVAYNGKKDTEDNRGDWGFIKKYNFGVVTTDDPLGFINYLEINGNRDTGRYGSAPWVK